MADAAEDWVRSWTSSLSKRAAAAQSLSDQVAQLNVSESDPDRMITVTVNGSGVMIDLQLGDGASGLRMDQLADKILRTMRRAQAALASRVSDVASQTVGRDSETARAVVSSFERRFPVEPESEEDADRPRWPSHGR
jgi:DNA-binding protein YbaB